MDYVIRAADREAFKRCRRAWDFSSTTRQNLRPRLPGRVFDLERALLEALAVYYYPGMWSWSREIVRPIASRAFVRSMRDQRQTFADHHSISNDQQSYWVEHLERGQSLLQRYFGWAETVDQFTPVRAQTVFTVNVPDPASPADDMVGPQGGAVRYRGRVPLLVADERNAYWVVDHRLVTHEWEDLEILLLDERSVSYCWAWERFYVGTRIAGTIHNEIRTSTPDPAPVGDQIEGRRRSEWSDTDARAGASVPRRRSYGGRLIKHQETESFRRTYIHRSRTSFEVFGEQLGREALAMTRTDLSLHPNPSRENCSRCEFRTPCIMLNEGADISDVLAESYEVDDVPEELQTGRIGSEWGFQTGQSNREMMRLGLPRGDRDSPRRY